MLCYVCCWCCLGVVGDCVEFEMVFFDLGDEGESARGWGSATFSFSILILFLFLFWLCLIFLL